LESEAFTAAKKAHAATRRAVMKVLIEDEDKKMRGVGIRCGLYTGRDEEVFETARVQLVAQYWYNPHSVSALGGPLNRRI
jgi:hypothetical protein